MPKGAVRCCTVPYGTGPRVALIELRPNCAHTQCWHAPMGTLVGTDGTTRIHFAPWRLCARSLALLRTRTRQEENQGIPKTLLDIHGGRGEMKDVNPAAHSM